ncbi:MAG: purine permease [Eubacterium sp.]|nr:purine permease [Eubacterium sp.]
MNASKKAGTKGLYQLDGRIPIRVAIPFGLQHILAMLVSNITPVIIVAGVCGIGGGDLAKLIQSTLVIAGIGTLIQLFPIWRIGSGLPIVMGVSFTFVSIFCYIGATYGYETILGAVLIGGIVEGVLGLFATYWTRIITPVVSGAVVTAIGFSLLPVGAKSFGGGSESADFGSWQNWLVGGVTILICIVLHAFGKGIVKNLSVLIGLAVGYILAVCLGMVDFSSVISSDIVGLPGFLSYDYDFNLPAILSVICIFLVSATETIGDSAALANAGLGRDITKEEIRGSIACDGFVSALSSVFSCVPITSYSENVGLVAMTGVVNRMAIASGAVILIIAGFIPVLGNILVTVPQPVLGGCTMMMLGMIVVSGIKMIARAGFSSRNVTLLSLSLSIGLGFTQVPQLFDIFPSLVKNIFAENCVAVVFLLAILLNLVLPKEKKAES